MSYINISTSYKQAHEQRPLTLQEFERLQQLINDISRPYIELMTEAKSLAIPRLFYDPSISKIPITMWPEGSKVTRTQARIIANRIIHAYICEHLDGVQISSLLDDIKGR